MHSAPGLGRIVTMGKLLLVTASSYSRTSKSKSIPKLYTSSFKRTKCKMECMYECVYHQGIADTLAQYDLSCWLCMDVKEDEEKTRLESSTSTYCQH